MNLKFRKSIAPVIATSLLIIIVVISMVSFQMWFGLYSSEVYVKAENDIKNTQGSINIQTVVGQDFYFKNDLENITIQKITIGNKDCLITPTEYEKGLQKIDLTECLNDSEGKVEVVVYTDKGIDSKYVYINSKQKEQNNIALSNIPKINSFSSNSTLIRAGQNINLSWNSANTDFCRVTGEGINTIYNSTGSVVIGPLYDRGQYNLTCEKSGTELKNSINVELEQTLALVCARTPQSVAITTATQLQTDLQADGFNYNNFNTPGIYYRIYLYGSQNGGGTSWFLDFKSKPLIAQGKTTLDATDANRGYFRIPVSVGTYTTTVSTIANVEHQINSKGITFHRQDSKWAGNYAHSYIWIKSEEDLSIFNYCIHADTYAYNYQVVSVKKYIVS